MSKFKIALLVVVGSAVIGGVSAALLSRDAGWSSKEKELRAIMMELSGGNSDLSSCLAKRAIMVADKYDCKLTNNKLGVDYDFGVCLTDSHKALNEFFYGSGDCTGSQIFDNK